MRLAIMVISLMIMLIIGSQSLLVYRLSSLANEGAASFGAVGVLVAFLFLLGGVLSQGVPLMSVIAFGLAGLPGFLAAQEDSPDMSIWAR